MEDYILIFIALGAAGVFNLFVCGMTIIAADRVDRLADEIKETVSGAN